MASNVDDLIYAPIPVKPEAQEKAPSDTVDPADPNYFPVLPCDVGEPCPPYDPGLYEGIPFWKLINEPSWIDWLMNGSSWALFQKRTIEFQAQERKALRHDMEALRAIDATWETFSLDCLTDPFDASKSCEPVWDVIL